MLTRTEAAGLAPLLHDAVVPGPDGYSLRLGPGLVRPLVKDEVPVRGFVEGWTPGALLTLFHPLLVLEFRHGSGRAGFWLLDGDGRFIGNEIARLPAALLDAVRSRTLPALAWLQATEAPGMPCEPPDAVRALLGLHLDVRREVARAARAADAPPVPDAVLERVLPPDPTDALAWLRGRDIMQNGQVLALGPGWQVNRVQTRLAPVIVLELLHEEGHAGIWYVDRHANYLGNNAGQLAGAFREALRASCAALFDQLWDRVILAPVLSPGPDLAWLLDCNPGTRGDLLAFHLAAEGDRRSLGWLLTDTLPPAMRYTVPAADGRLLVLDPEHTRSLCQQFLRSELFRLVDLGTMSWPSPVDGRRLEVPARALYLDDHCFAYQVHDERHGLTFYVFAMAGFFRTFAVYFPAADLVVARDEGHMATARPYCERARARLLQHAAQFGADLVGALERPDGEVVHAFRGFPAIHLGHFVWQDLSGVSYLVDAFPPERLPRFYVFESHRHPELYGPIDEIFPELAGKVVRLDDTLNAHVGTFYRERQRVMKSTGISVPAQVGTRIIASLRRSERWAAVAARAAAAAAAGPVVLVGLRIGNRTVDDMQGFAHALIGMLEGELGTLTVVVDGHNSAGDDPGATYASFGDNFSGGTTFLQREVGITAFLARAFAGSGVTIVDNIGRPIPESVLWCSRADFFVAPWGAALAKYRWVCNTPGLTTVGRWNLEHRHDLSIYHHPGAMENPTPLLFNAVEAVEDLAGTEAGADAQDRSNYRLDQAMVFEQVRGLIETTVRRRADRTALQPAV